MAGPTAVFRQAIGICRRSGHRGDRRRQVAGREIRDGTVCFPSVCWNVTHPVNDYFGKEGRRGDR